MSPAARVTLALGCAAVAACARSRTKVLTDPVAVTPAGARVALRVQGETADRLGELLVCDSLGLVLRSGRVVRIAWSRVAAMDVADRGSYADVLWGEHVGRTKQNRLALISRFPQGLDSARLSAVLQLLHQDTLDVVR